MLAGKKPKNTHNYLKILKLTRKCQTPSKKTSGENVEKILSRKEKPAPFGI